MKNGLALVTALILLLVVAPAFAQKKRPCMPEEGSWVIVNNIKSPRESVVYFYTPEKQLIGSESFHNKKLRARRARVVRQLNSLLYEHLTAWRKAKEDAWAAK